MACGVPCCALLGSRGQALQEMLILGDDTNSVLSPCKETMELHLRHVTYHSQHLLIPALVSHLKLVMVTSKGPSDY